MNIVVARSDFTERWSCREGDILVWLRAPEYLEANDDFRVADFWYLRDGEHVIVSNRAVDFPAWFTLHPTEAVGAEADRIMAKLNEGWEPEDPVDGPNVWRVCAGDRVVWVGHRSDSPAADDGVLRVLDCRENALVAGEGRHNGIEEWMAFGDLPTEQPTSEQGRLMRAGVAAAKSLGAPRNVATEWFIG